MDANEFDELSGRIDGIAQALLRLTGALEMALIIDGPRLSEGWRSARPAQLATDAVRQAARKTLLKLALDLDDARSHRQ